MKRRWTCAILAAVLFSSPAISAAEDLAAGLGIRLATVPEATQNDPRAQAYIVDHLPPGTTITREIEVANNTGADAAVDVYAGAASIDDKHGFTITDGRTENELTTWISTEPSTIQVPQGQRVRTTATIAVPKDAPEAEQYAVIWAQAANGAEADTGTNIATRVGIRVYLSVGPGNGPPANFEINKLTPGRADDGSAVVFVDIKNTGGRAVDITGEMSLSNGPGGVSAPAVKNRALTLAPGKAGNAVFAFSKDLPPGAWTAAVELQSGFVKKSAETDVTFPDRGVGEQVLVDKSSWVPWIVLVGAVTLLAVLVSIFLAYRKRQRVDEE